jgi:hypothetical protein
MKKPIFLDLYRIIMPIVHFQKQFSYQNAIKSGIYSNEPFDYQVLRDGDYYYITGTSLPHWARQEKDGNLNKGVVLYRSKKLLKWNFANWVFEHRHETKWHYRRFWAP